MVYALSSSFQPVFIEHLYARCAAIHAGNVKLDKIQMLSSWDLQRKKRALGGGGKILSRSYTYSKGTLCTK